MKYALFLGCKIPSKVPAYEAATRAVLARLGVGLHDLPFDCCGYPVRGLDRDSSVVMAARNLALAHRAGLDVLTPCKCCFGNLRHAQRCLDEDADLRERVASALSAEGLALPTGTRVEHLLPVLGREVGLDTLSAAVVAPRAGLRVAAHYGCHALRPSVVTRFDNPMAPTLFEDLVRATGATAVDWPRRLECCGEPLHESNPTLSTRIAQGKVSDARESGADLLVTACPYCHMRFSSIQAGLDDPLPLMLYPQLLGLAMGIPPPSLGLSGSPSN